jgi:glycosyltransferase involved in cell wall biosynthesis
MASDQIELSLVIETATNEVTRQNRLGRNLQYWLAQAEAIAPRSFEILVCAPDLRIVESLSPAIRFHVEPGAGYYALKNAGANRARGRVVFFGDADCRPCDGFFVRLLEAFDSGLSKCWAGRSFYDGGDFLTRMNTATSFGYLHDPDNTYPIPVLGHNVAILRECYDRDPFGPYPGRFGGDLFLALNMKRQNRPFRRSENTVIYHENLSYSLRATIDRHMMECFGSVLLFWRIDGQLPMLAVLKRALFSIKHRLSAVRHHGPRFGLKRWQWPLIVMIVTLYGFLDLVVATAIVTVPPWRRRWLRYQFGLDENQLSRFLSSDAHSLQSLGLGQ